MIRPKRTTRLIFWLPLLALAVLPLLLIGGRSPREIPRRLSGLLESGGLQGLSIEKIQHLLEQSAAALPNVTKLETPTGYTSTTSGGKLLFAQIADGDIPSLHRFMQTTVILLNDSEYAAAGTLNFYNDDGAPLTLKIGGKTSSSFPVSLKAGETKRLETSGTGALKVGWAFLRTDQPVTGTSSFSVRNAAGQVFTDVGVSEAMLSREFTLFADSIGQEADTGVALINPDDAALDVQVELINSSGATVRTKALHLSASGHLARNLTELFNDVSGIQEFEGTLRVTADRDFGGTTLRSVGSLLTSVPMVPAPEDVLLRDQLYFPHVADGTSSGLTIRTSVLLFNNRDQSVSGTLEFVDSDGDPLTLKIGNRRASSFDYTLAPRAVKRIVTSGEGGVKGGWAHFTADGHIAGTAIFQILDSAGVPVNEVGVSDASEMPIANFVADTLGNARTGYAIANPGSEDNDVEFSLYDKNGTLKAEKTVTLGAGAHISQFVDELFKGVSGIGEFEGRV
ncbi:MAG: hypothetical protein P8Z74_11120, partial [Acidobacteriota bacterium]